MKTIALVLYSLAGLADAAAFGLILRSTRETTHVLTEWDNANPERHDDGSMAQGLLVNKMLHTITGSRTTRRLGVALLAAGIGLGTAGNIVSALA